MPNNRAIIDVKPSNFGIIDVKPKLSVSIIKDTEKVYIDTAMISKGQTFPWGLNWLITYPVDMTFIVTRL